MGQCRQRAERDLARDECGIDPAPAAGPAGSLRDPGELVEVWEQLLAEKPSRESTPQADEPAEPEARLVESLIAYGGRVETPVDEYAAAIQPVKAEEALERLQAQPGASALLGLSPNVGKPNVWGQIAYITACERTGTAQTVSVAGRADILADHSITIWSTGDWPPTARVSCGFTVPAEGLYLCAVVLKSWDPRGTVAECLIDSRSFGQRPVYGTKQSYSFLSRLGPGWHSFTVRELHFAFRFYSLTVFQIPIVVEN